MIRTSSPRRLDGPIHRPATGAAGVMLALLLVPAAFAADQDLAGHWNGTVELPGQELEFDVDLRSGSDGWSGDISIPAQGLRDVPLAGIEVEGDSVRFAIPGIPGEPTFEGTLAGDVVEGDLSQGGATFPFSMTSGVDLATRAREALEGIDPIIEQALEDFSVPGLALAVVADDEVVLAKGYGVRDLGTGEPVTEDTLFAIGSTTKAFAAFVLGLLVDEGKISWDQPVIELLPDFRLHDDHATRRLKVKDLVRHSSGLPRHDAVWYNSPDSREELFARLRHLEPSRDLGETFQYQNLMFMTAGLLAERVTGKSWEELVRERILDPLDMERTNFSVETSKQDPNHAAPHAIEDQEARVIPFRNIDTIGPAGSINSSVSEMTQWIRLQLGGGEIGGERLIETATLQSMHTPQIAAGSYPTDGTTLPMGYGYGWMTEAHRGHFVVQHGGGIDGFISWVALLPHDGLGVVAYTNATGMNPLPTAVARTVIDRVLGLEEIDYLQKGRDAIAEALAAQAEAEKSSEAKRQEGTSPSHDLAEYAGTYAHPGYGEVEVSQGGDGLSVVYNGIPAELEHWHYDTFNAQKLEGGDPALDDTKIIFRLDVNGEISELEAQLEAAVDAIVFERQPDPRLFEGEYLDQFVGVYESSTQRSTVARSGDQLTLSLPGQPIYRLEPIRENEFELQGMPGFSVEFVRDDDGAVTAIRFVQPNGIFEAKRVEEP
ncbi:MAG TPA: serine hydrolase [Thermoanaerobaculia bacterium]|nr:serine hydrolase [Thermoanaerobaculia bacterium]